MNNRLDIFIRDNGDGTQYIHKGNNYGFTTKLGLEAASSFAFQLARDVCGLEARIVPEKFVACPDCGNDLAVHRTYRETTVIGTGEMLDDDNEYLVTVEADPGYTIECKECGFWDGEPPQF